MTLTSLLEKWEWMRAHASDRVKGDEELAEEEKARLEELEVFELVICVYFELQKSY